MAERIQVELVDDIDGSRAQHTVTFALDGVTYEIDLSERHARDLRSVFARYIQYARDAQQQETPRTTKQQEREERRVRQTNRQLTEQIRGAAQRSRERHKVGQDDGAAEEQSPSRNTEPDLVNGSPERSSLEHSGSGATGATDEKSDDDRSDVVDTQKAEDESGQSRPVPAVSLPQFSSASD